MASFSACREDHFQKDLSKTDLTIRFCKIGLRNILFIFGRKNGRLLFVCFVATLSDFGLRTLKKIEVLIEQKNMIVRKQLFDVWLGNCSYSADLLDLQRCN